MGSGASSEARAARARQVMREAGRELPESVPDAEVDGAAQQTAALMARAGKDPDAMTDREIAAALRAVFSRASGAMSQA